MPFSLGGLKKLFSSDSSERTTSDDVPSGNTTKVVTDNSRKEVEDALVSIPEVRYPFGKEKTARLNKFFQSFGSGAQNSRWIRETVIWINNNMVKKDANKVLEHFRNIVFSEKSKEATRVYNTLDQYVKYGDPIDDWTPLYQESNGVVSLDVIRNDMFSYSFLEDVTQKKIDTNLGGDIYVVHLDKVPDDADHEVKKHIQQRVKETIAKLHKEYQGSYIIAVSDKVKDFFQKEEIYDLKPYYQQNVRAYRDAIASYDGDEVGDVVLHKKEQIQLGVKKTIDFLQNE